MVDDKPWVGTEVPCNSVDRLLFNLSTTILLGNVSKAKKIGTIAGSMERPERHLDQSIEGKDHYSNAS
jgi:hypothetical protein